MNYVATLLALLGSTATLATVRAEEPPFQVSREVKTPPLEQEELLGVRLDADVFADVRDGLPDLRLYDDVGLPTPYVVRKAQATKTRTVRKTWTPQRLEAKPLGDDGLEITVKLDDRDPRPEGVRLVTALRDFEHRVRVFTSADGKNWESAADEALVFDYSRFVDVRNDDVSLPKTEQRHYRFVVDDATAEQESELLTLTRRLRGADETERTEKVTIDRRPFRIDRLEFRVDERQERAAGDEKIVYPISGFRVETDAKNRRTVVTIDVPRPPLTALRIETPDRNFSRRTVVEVKATRGVQTEWRSIGEGTLSRVDFKNLQRENSAIGFPESRHAQYRLVIDDRDSPPLQITGVAAEGNAYDLFFMAAPGQRYRLKYGSPDAPSASLDAAAVEEVLNKGFRPLAAELGEPHREPSVARATPWRWTELLNNRLLMGGVIVLLAAVLGWGLVRAVKRVENLPG